ncbi:MAG: 5-deoxy-glucuronate isomerase [Myxococcales bacterium]|nr:5-deoxy-glucuronate isomerase [Myxococcales bacterium]
MNLLHRPNRLPPDSSGTLVSVDPARAGWELISFEVLRLGPGERRERDTGSAERCLVFLGGRASVESSEGDFGEVGERAEVFGGRCHALYLPPGTRYALTALGELELAEASAPTSARHPARHIRPAEVAIEERGDGNASRTIHHVLPPERPAERLMVVEVFTPSGNWSSYPPHKHDEHRPPHEHDLEEIYYFRVDRPGGWGLQRIYTPDLRIDEAVVVRDGDLVLVREGYHPVVAAPGFNVYYLNVLAGSGRSMAASDDPELAFVRASWKRPER